MDTRKDILDYIDAASIPDLPPFWIAPGQAVYDVQKFLEVHTNIVRQYSEKPMLTWPYENRLSLFANQHRDGTLQYLTAEEVAYLDNKVRFPKQLPYVKHATSQSTPKPKGRKR